MTSSTVHIVEASSAEQIAAVRALFAEYAASLGWEDTDGRLTAELDGLPGTYSPPEGSLMLAVVGDEPAGALGLQTVPLEARIPGTGAETAGELKRLFVSDRFRRFGVGRALMLRAEAEAVARGYDSLVLTTSAEMMPLAQGLYDSLGYVETVPYRDDMPYPQIRWMSKALAPAL
jgi:GNAT superfamily N-acetyltransferase